MGAVIVNRRPWGSVDATRGLSDKIRMFAITVEGGFRAQHHVRFADGSTEEPHAHDWRVRVTLRRPRLDTVGMVADFDRVRDLLADALAPFEGADLNVHPLLHGLNPTAEVVAKRTFDRLIELGLSDLFRVEITEAPGCVAAYESAP